MEIFYFNIAFSVAVYVLIVHVTGMGAQMQYDFYVRSFVDKISTVGLIINATVSSKLHCANLCSATDKCVSYFHFEKGSQCQLHGGVLTTTRRGFRYHKGWKYYRSKEPIKCPTDRGYTLDCSEKLCYKVSCSEAVNYAQAADVCASEFGHPIMIRNQEMNDYVTDLTKSCPDYDSVKYFVDGSNIGNGGQWTFSNGEMISWAMWAPTQPNNNTLHNPGGEHYLNVYFYGAQMMWNDIDDIAFPGRFICEIDVEIC